VFPARAYVHAVAYRAAGRAVEAIPLYERTLADRERVQGSGAATAGVPPGTIRFPHILAVATDTVAACLPEQADPRSPRSC
jgi:hypothetical protein